MDDTKSKDLDHQIEAIFKNLGDWQSGKLNGEAVDNFTHFVLDQINKSL